MDRTIQVLLVHPSPWEGRTFAHGMLVRTGSVTWSEPRRSLEDRGYLGMSLTDQRNMAASMEEPCGGVAPQCVFARSPFVDQGTDGVHLGEREWFLANSSIIVVSLKHE